MQIIKVRLINSKDETKGCEKAPAEILGELKKIKSNENKKFIDFDKLNLDEIHVDLNNIQEANHLIFENSKEIFEKNFKCFFIGGDHSISYSIVRAFNKIQENPLLIVFDAYADCSENKGFNKTWLRKLAEEGFRNIVLVCARNLSEEDSRFLKENNIALIKMDVLNEDLEGVCDLIMERARSSKGFYISVDISCVDPGFAPGCCYLEPGGLSSREIIYFLKRLSFLNNFRGADIVEINPDKDINKMSVKLGARLLAEMI